MKRFPYPLVCGLILSALALGFCQTPPPLTSTPEPPIVLRFTYWGSEAEKEAVSRMTHAFETANPGIRVETYHFPPGEYMTQLQAMQAAGKGPDIGYLADAYTLQWASEGKVLDLTEYFNTNPDLGGRLPGTFYYFAPNKTLGTNTAVEITLLFYNKDLFDQAGLPYPPARAEEAWTWEEFVEAAKRLTTDIEGRHPDDPGFDPTSVDVYGLSFGTEHWSYTDYYPFIYSNGGEIVNDDGTRLMLDSPEAVDAIQKLHDLLWLHHVAPTPAEAERRPTGDVQFQTGKVAMVISGQWKLLDYAAMEDLNLGVAVLPKLKEPKTLILGSPTVIFSNTPHPEAALKLYKFHNDPQQVDLFARGLWMPLQEKYYTDEASIALWIDNPAHPPESREAILAYTLCCVVRTPHYYVKNFGQIADEVIQPAMEQVWNDTTSVADAMARAVTEAALLLNGRWDR
jgi:multiple sugar transport system substrate-binding protein